MRHLATIQSEFLREARDWDKLTYVEQREYLEKHPGSKKRITARPSMEPTEKQMTKLMKAYAKGLKTQGDDVQDFASGVTSKDEFVKSVTKALKKSRLSQVAKDTLKEGLEDIGQRTLKRLAVRACNSLWGDTWKIDLRRGPVISTDMDLTGFDSFTKAWKRS